VLTGGQPVVELTEEAVERVAQRASVRMTLASGCVFEA
jgi:hypothetical protein